MKLKVSHFGGSITWILTDRLGEGATTDVENLGGLLLVETSKQVHLVGRCIQYEICLPYIQNKIK